MKPIVIFSCLFLLLSTVKCQELTIAPENITAMIKDSVELKCVFNEPVNCGWQRNGLPITVPSEEDGYTYSNRPNPFEKGPDCSIKISSITEPDFANWRCSTIGTNTKPIVAAPEIWISKQVTPSDPVIFFKGNSTNAIKLPSPDEPANNLVCESLKGNPAPILSWELNGREYLGRVSTRREGLDLYSVKLTWDRDGGWQLFNDSTEVVCKATHPGFKYSKLAKIILKNNYPPKRVEVLVEGFNKEDVRIGFNEKVVLSCVADGQPLPTFSWEVWSEEDFLWKLFNNSDQNITIGCNLVGKYRCKASNDLNKYQPKVSTNKIIVCEKEYIDECYVVKRDLGTALSIALLCLLILGFFSVKQNCMKRKTQPESNNVRTYSLAEQGVEETDVGDSVKHVYESLKEPDYLDPIPMKEKTRSNNDNNDLYVNVTSKNNCINTEKDYITVIA